MKKLIYLFSLMAIGWLTGCSSDDEPLPNDYIATTQEGSSTFVLKGYEPVSSEQNSLYPEGFEFPLIIRTGAISGTSSEFLADNSKTLVAMTTPADASVWNTTAPIVKDKTYWVRHQTKRSYIYLKLRIAYILGNNVGVEYIHHSTEVLSQNSNDALQGSYTGQLAIPHLNPDNYYVEHTVTMGGEQILNYALEWNSSLNHAAWVAFTFDEITTGDVTGRTDAWLPDPQLPAAYQTTNDHHRNDGFDRGHLCASEDRVYSVAANQQTFYFSNITPQFNSFNGGYWAAFEYRVRYWSRYVFSKLHVTKGASLNNLITNYTGTQKDANGVYPTTDADGLTLHGLACPRYYFMALLGELNGNYQALGFWIEHREDYGYEYGDTVPTDVMQQHVVTIDELEELTGLDFFCNLPDQVEERVEAQYDLSDWRW